MKFHINEYTNVELHFQNKVLTTLDTEAKTKKNTFIIYYLTKL